MIEIKVPQRAARGSTITGAFAITGAESETLRKNGEAVAELVCSITHARETPSGGLDDPAAELMELKELHTESVRFGRSASGNFEFSLPESLPATYSGKLISVCWYVKVKVDVPFALDKSGSKEIVVE
jgi:hypothetical protein